MDHKYPSWNYNDMYLNTGVLSNAKQWLKLQCNVIVLLTSWRSSRFYCFNRSTSKHHDIAYWWMNTMPPFGSIYPILFSVLIYGDSCKSCIEFGLQLVNGNICNTCNKFNLSYLLNYKYTLSCLANENVFRPFLCHSLDFLLVFFYKDIRITAIGPRNDVGNKWCCCLWETAITTWIIAIT